MNAIAILNRKVASIIMKSIVPGSKQATAEVYIERGISVGQKTYDLFEDQFQILSWKDDTSENIRKEFDQFLAKYSN